MRAVFVFGTRRNTVPYHSRGQVIPLCAGLSTRLKIGAVARRRDAPALTLVESDVELSLQRLAQDVS
jgi:hypothetical protein